MNYTAKGEMDFWYYHCSGLCRNFQEYIGFFRKIFPMWIVLRNDSLAEAECISAETHHSLDNHSACWPPSRPVLGLFCCDQTLSGREVEVGRAEWEKARVEGARKELTRADGAMAFEMIPFRSWGDLWDTHSTISLR